MKHPVRLALAITVLFALPMLARAQTLSDPRLIVDTVASGFALPSQMEFLADDDFFVIEQRTGKILRVTGGTAVEVGDVAVNTGSMEGGLLGIAVHPQFDTNGFVYLFYSESSTGADTNVPANILGNRVYRYTYDGSNLVNPLLLMDLPANPGFNHNGGILIFGPDDKLYVVMGDQLQNGVLQNVAGGQPDDTGVIFRLEDDGTPAAGNPFLAVPGYEAYFAYGIRNGYGLDFDPVTGALWQTENGPAEYDEINRVDAGLNSGWKQIMGPDSRDPQGVADLVMVAGAFYSDPEFSWLDSRGITALEFFDSDQLGAAYENTLFVTDFTSGSIFHFELNAARDALVFTDPLLQDLVADDNTERDLLIIGDFISVTDLDTGPDGNLYVLDRPPPGTVYRVRHVVRDLDTSNSDVTVSACLSTQVAEVTATYRVYGFGPGVVVPSVTVHFYLDVVEPWSLVQSYVDTDLVDGDEVMKVFTVNLPTPAPHTLIMVLDPEDAVAEDREANNQGTQLIACSPVAAPAVGSSLVLEPNVPNPFGVGTTIHYQLSQAGHVEVDVFDVRGRRVQRLISQLETEGSHGVFWDGRDEAGNAVAAGVYHVRARFGGEVKMRAIVLGG